MLETFAARLLRVDTHSHALKQHGRSLQGGGPVLACLGVSRGILGSLTRSDSPNLLQATSLFKVNQASSFS